MPPPPPKPDGLYVRRLGIDHIEQKGDEKYKGFWIRPNELLSGFDGGERDRLQEELKVRFPALYRRYRAKYK